MKTIVLTPDSPKELQEKIQYYEKQGWHIHSLHVTAQHIPPGSWGAGVLYTLLMQKPIEAD